MNQYFLTKRNNNAVRIQKVKIKPKIQFPLTDKLKKLFQQSSHKIKE